MSSEGSKPPPEKPDEPPKKPYEPPKLIVLGSVADLTQESPKLHGMSDGHGFGSQHWDVTNTSR